MTLSSYITLISGHGATHCWPLNETSGTSAADAIGVIAATYTGGFTLNRIGPGGIYTPPAGGAPGGGVLLNGSTGYIATGKTLAQLFGASPAGLTVEWWMKPNSAYNAGTIRGMWGASNAGNDFSAQLFSDNNFYVGCNAAADQRVTFAASLTNYQQKWSHYAFVATIGGNSLLYRNGVLIGTFAGATAFPVPTNTLDIGRYNTAGGSNFVGKMALFATYPVAISQATALAHYQAGATPSTTFLDLVAATESANLVDVFPMEEGDAVTVTGRSGTILNFLNSASWRTTEQKSSIRDDVTNYAVNFPISSGACLEAAASTLGQFGATQPFSVVFSFETDSKTGEAAGQALVSNLDPANHYRGWEIAIDGVNKKLLFYLVDNFDTPRMIAKEFNWYPLWRSGYVLCLTYDGSHTAAGVRLYARKSEVPSYSVTSDTLLVGSTTTNSIKLRFGGRTDGSLTYSGFADKLALWNVALSSAEAMAILAAAEAPADATPALDSATNTALRAALQAKCIDDNIVVAAGDATIFAPGTEYTQTASVVYPKSFGAWDASINAIAASAFGSSYAKRGVNWIGTLIANAQGSGMLPGALGESTIYTIGTQIPITAYGLLWCYNKSGRDATALSTISGYYTALKNQFSFWEGNRRDASGVPTFGTQRGSTPSNFQISTDAGLEAGEDVAFGENETFLINGYRTGTQSTLGPVSVSSGQQHFDCGFPTAAAALAVEADAISQLATALGHTADATAYAASRDFYKQVCDTFMWDEVRGCYQPVAAVDAAILVGTLTANAAIGATTLSVNIPSDVCLAYGGLLTIQTDPTVAVAPNLICRAQYGGSDATKIAAGNPVTLTLFSALTIAASTGDKVVYRRFTDIRSESMHSKPMWAGIPTAAKAARIVNEHLNYTFDGATAVTSSWLFGTGRYTGIETYGKYVHWMPTTIGTPDATAVDSYTFNVSESNFLIAAYRNGEASATKDPYILSDDPTYETITSTRPVTVTVTGTWAGNCVLSMALYSFTDQLLSTQTLSANGTATFAPAGGTTWEAPGYIKFSTTGSTGSVKLNKVVFSTTPASGLTLYATPYGILATPQLSRYSFRVPWASDRHYFGDQPGNGLDGAAAREYWQAGIWGYSQFFANQGLLRYGYLSLAIQLALAYGKALYRDYLNSGKFYEFMRRSGSGVGGSSYTGTALAAVMLDDAAATTAAVAAMATHMNNGAIR